ncbi:MAG: protein kinase domain-containing protein [Myxococcota bacterium]
MPDQRCPNCQTQHDVSIFVTGQRVRCSKCGIRFEVQRSDASVVGGASIDEPAGEEQDPVAPPSKPPSSREQPRAASGGSAAVDLSPSSIAEDATAISQGVSVPGYEIMHVLGRGGMGDVYLGRQSSLNRHVAIKVLASHLAGDRDFVVRFEKEAKALATLSHPNVVSIIDRGSHGGILYFVMEYVDGHSLRDLLRKGPVAPADAIRIVTQVCNAIDYAHSKGVIHRDLKPENILIDVHGHVKVADFGLAGIVGGDDRIHITRTDVAMGTFNYMAPEQRKNAREVDARADLFSLGVVLYELLTGEVPVGRFQLPSQVLEGLDPKVDEIVERALQTNPGERYQRASAIHQDLSALLESSRLTVAPAPARTFGGGSGRVTAGAMARAEYRSWLAARTAWWIGRARVSSRWLALALRWPFWLCWAW